MRFRTGTCATWTLAILALVLTAPAAADEDRPTAGDVVTDAGPDASAGQPAPVVSPAAKPLPRGASVVRTIPNAPSADKGSLFTTGAIGAEPAPLAEHERIKLARAREAVAAARALGTLFAPEPLSFRPVRSRAELEREKWERFKISSQKAPSDMPAAAGVGEGLPAIQVKGSTGLSDLERQKLEAYLRGDTFIGPPVPVVPAGPRDEPVRTSDEPADVKGGR